MIKYFSVESAAKFSGLSKSYIYKKSADRSIPIVKIGNRCLIPIQDFELWLEEHRADDNNKKIINTFKRRGETYESN